MKIARIASALLAGVVVAATVAAVAPTSAEAASVAGTPGRYVAVQPCRLLDTRASGRVAAGSSVTVTAANVCGVPSNAVAVQVVLTATDTTGGGYVTAYPANTGQPDASNLNYAAGETRANAAAISLNGGAFSGFVGGSSTNLLADVVGAWVPASTSTSGRLEIVAPVRALDTRSSGAAGAGQVITVPLPAGVPSSATAIAANITVTNTRSGGYLTAYPAGSAAPNASNLNWDNAGQTRAAGGILPVSSAGVSLYVSAGTDVLLDVSGYMTGASAPSSSSGLLIATSPKRTMDTRSNSLYAGALAPAGNSSLSTDPSLLRPTGSLPSGSIEVVNVTVVDPDADGYAALSPAGYSAGGTSAVNWSAGSTVANFGIVPGNVSDSVAVTTSSALGMDVLVDVMGVFTGSSTPYLASYSAAAFSAPQTYLRHVGWTNNTPGSSECRSNIDWLINTYNGHLKGVGSFGGSITDVGAVSSSALGLTKFDVNHGQPVITIGCDKVGSISKAVLVHEMAHAAEQAMGADSTNEQLTDCTAAAIWAKSGVSGSYTYGYGCPFTLQSQGVALAARFLAA